MAFGSGPKIKFKKNMFWGILVQICLAGGLSISLKSPSGINKISWNKYWCRQNQLVLAVVATGVVGAAVVTHLSAATTEHGRWMKYHKPQMTIQFLEQS